MAIYFGESRIFKKAIKEKIIKQEVMKILYIKNLLSSEKGISGCAVLIVIVLVGVVAAGGFLYYQFSGVFRHGPEAVEQIFTVMDEIESLEDLEEIEDIEDLEKFEGIEDIEELEALEALDPEDIEQITNIAPIVRDIYERIPEGIIEMFQEEENEEVTEEPDEAEDLVEDEPERSPEELLPDSISIHPDITLVDFQEFEDVPDFIWEEIEDRYINENSVVFDYETDFPEREIAEFRELDEVPDDITDEMIEEERDSLTELYNIHAIADWHKDELTERGWQIEGDEEKLEDKLFYQHDQEGHLIIIPPQNNIIYTP